MKSSYDYAIIVALDEEAEYLGGVLKCGAPSEFESHTLWPIVDERWAEFGKGALVSSGAMGTGPAAAAVRACVCTLGVRLVANIGIAGRVDTDLNIGDLIIPSKTYDVTHGGKVGGTEAETKFHHAPEERLFRGSIVRLAHARFKANSKPLKMINDRLTARFRELELMPPRGIRIITRPLACVPTVGANDAYRRSLLNINRQIAAMEMESAGVALAAEELQVEAICIRGISDGADHNKRALEEANKDENRRLALEAAAAALESVLSARAERDLPLAVGIELARASDIRDEDWAHQLTCHEVLFSHLIHVDGEPVANPIKVVAGELSSDGYSGPIALLGEKGVGKTTFFRYIHRTLGWHNATKGDVAILLRVRALEIWDEVLDSARTQERLDRVKADLSLIIESAPGNVYLLVDGLNLTGKHRVSLVSDVLRHIDTICGVRLIISAETAADLDVLYENYPLDVRKVFTLDAVEMNDSHAEDAVRAFAEVRGSSDGEDVIHDLRRKGVRAIDLFVLAQFFGPFRAFNYMRLATLAECYALFCAGKLSKQANDAEASGRLSQVAATAFEILISNNKNFSDLKDGSTAQLISSHASVTNYLVARHIVEAIKKDRSSWPDKAGASKQWISRQLNYVFPADVNNYTKQMMTSNPNVEAVVVEFVRRRHKALPPLARSHCAYLAGRVSRNNAQEMISLLRQMAHTFKPRGRIDRNHRMLHRCIYISLCVLGDDGAEKIYAHTLLTDREEAEFNRGFHLEYYGDARFDPAGGMFSRDNGDIPCNRTFANLLDRLTNADGRPSLIDLLTLLSLAQTRLQRGTLREKHRRDALELLSGNVLAGCSPLPENVRGYVGRMREDLSRRPFNLATVLQEWQALTVIERSGWLKRRREAESEEAAFWRGRRVESLAEHELSTIALAEIFLSSEPEAPQDYSKPRIIEMLLIHDLAESRIGDRLPGQTDPEAEQEALWQYGAFATYQGVGDLWRIPELFAEFTYGRTPDAQIAQDLDRLQFLLQARAYRPGMSSEGAEACERSCERIVTPQVRGIYESLKGYPADPRFVPGGAA